ncbi:bacillithiol system redox-active protein YtxJ [Crocinitomix algicola]|uniref:bacillithiol system redox-active protein YtxJ n=1 Tax=Crocinitomix algicola TaxID=1740263 RepID=UPI00082D4EC9|nr:bacillithiol system redox-active protein YtxJ [Crocinitomix algicola]
MGLFGFGKQKSKENKINWVSLKDPETLNHLIVKDSFEKPVVFFKHSTRCSISSMALNRLESNWNIKDDEAVPVYLDLIQFRAISNAIAERLAVVHQSPQIIIVKEGKAVYSSSHNQIDAETIKANL